MFLHVLGSESKGNLYILTSDTGQHLILEAGLPIKEVKKALDFDLSGVVGCLVTHQHGDHSKYITSYAKAGIDVFCSKPTILALGLRNEHRVSLYTEIIFTIGEFRIRPFPVPHSVPCHGFLISHQATGHILFVTDAAMIPHKFNGLTHVLIESNYSDEAMHNDHGLGSHMALDVALDFIRANHPEHLRNIVLLHLSASNSDEKEFIRQVKEVAPHADVVAADKGITVNLNKLPF